MVAGAANAAASGDVGKKKKKQRLLTPAELFKAMFARGAQPQDKATAAEAGEGAGGGGGLAAIEGGGKLEALKALVGQLDNDDHDDGGDVKSSRVGNVGDGKESWVFKWPFHSNNDGLPRTCPVLDSPYGSSGGGGGGATGPSFSRAPPGSGLFSGCAARSAVSWGELPSYDTGFLHHTAD